MRTRSFIGLVLLVAILMVVSIPALLDPAAEGIEAGMVKAGLLNDEERAFQQARKIDASQSDEPVEGRVMLKGHVLDEESGDLRDTVTVEKRGSNEHGRLVEGDRRVLLPGQLNDQDAYSLPPIGSDEGMVLDDTGCPVVPDGTSLSELFEDPDTRRAYQQKANGADEPKACSQSLNDRLDADQETTPDLLPGDRRQLSAMGRGTSERALIDAYAATLYAELFGVDAFGGAETDAAASSMRERSGER